jgi:hypothetical protein
VAVEDASNKSGMLLRVLQPAAFGTTWYGKVGGVGGWVGGQEARGWSP